MGYGAIFLLVLTIGSSAIAKIDYYCAICPDHTLCHYSGPGPACKDIGHGGISDMDRKFIVDLHNWYRTKVARGFETRGVNGPQPRAANLMMLSWDEELAWAAQTWADQCTFSHDICRDVSRWEVGQNMYWSWRFPISQEPNWTVAIDSWFDEVAAFNPKYVERYRFDGSTTHYTQMLWHSTTRIGCGRRNYGPNKLYVCNYGPAGNWVNEEMYSIGEECSECPDGTICNDGLCQLVIDGTPLRDAQAILLHKKVEGDMNTTEVPVTIPASQTNETDAGVSKTLRSKGEDSTGKRYNLVEAVVEDGSKSELSINFNFIDAMDIINSDEEIKRDIEELKLKFLIVARKIIEKSNPSD